jgi:O-antigen ligase
MQKRNLRTGRLLWLGCAVILLGVPFHALLTAWLASHFGHFDAIRLWKEVLLALLATLAGVMLVRHPSLRRELFQHRFAQACLVFILYCVLMFVAGILARTVAWPAAVYGLIIDIRGFVFLLVMLVAAHLAPLPLNRRRWILIPALMVIGFGLLQLTVLPADVLKHVGYGPGTLPAFQAVDNKPSVPRIQSTLRGPNPLGTYLVPILLSFLAVGWANKKWRTYSMLAFVAGTIVVLGTYSRSALLGLLLGLSCFGYWSLKRSQAKRLFIISGAALLIIAGGLVWGLRNNDTFQNFVFHTNEQSTSVTSSNAQHSSALKSAISDIVHHPLGRGVGSAGPASFRNRGHEARIAENFYLQIGQETGVIGIILFLGVLGAILRALWSKRSDIQVRAVLAGFVAILSINLVSHAWADDTLVYISFALLAFVLIKTSTKSENLAKL